MRIEKLNNHINGKIIFITGFIMAILLVIIINLFWTKAKYQVTKNVQIVNGNVNYSLADLNVLALKVQDSIGIENYTLKDEVPSGNYEVNTEKSYCKYPGDNIEHKDIPMEFKDNKVYIGITKKGTKCYIYLDYKKTASDLTLAKLGKASTPGEIGGFGTIDTGEHNTLYSDEDDFGTTFYFRGKVKDNWVKFGKSGTQSGSGNDLYWRIIRINGDGTIRLIYAGEGRAATEDDGYTTNGTNALINTTINVKYNDSDYGRAEYVGFQYKTGQKHGYGTDSSVTKSNVLTVLDTWFKTNLTDEFASGNGKIDPNAGFCNDRRNSQSAVTTWGSETDDGGTAGTTTWYGAHLRLRPGGNNPSTSNKSKPTFKCSYSTTINSDYFTYTGATGIKTTTQTTVIGTRSLQYPVGLITADEVTYAGGLHNQNNKDYYLNNQTGSYWTMSPFRFDDSSAFVFIVNTTGNLSSNPVYIASGVRPVINLKADITFKAGGTGEYNKPYEVS